MDPLDIHISCRKCRQPFLVKNIAKHAENNHECSRTYSQDQINDLKDLSKEVYKAKKKRKDAERYLRKKEERAEKYQERKAQIAEQYQDKKAKIAEQYDKIKRAEKYQKIKLKIAEKYRKDRVKIHLQYFRNKYELK